MLDNQCGILQVTSNQLERRTRIKNYRIKPEDWTRLFYKMAMTAHKLQYQSIKLWKRFTGKCLFLRCNLPDVEAADQFLFMHAIFHG